MVGCDDRLEKFWSIFSFGYEFNSSLYKTGLHVEFLLQKFKEGEFGRVAEIFHFCFMPIMGAVRLKNLPSKEKRDKMLWNLKTGNIGSFTWASIRLGTDFRKQ